MYVIVETDQGEFTQEANGFIPELGKYWWDGHVNKGRVIRVTFVTGKKENN